MDALIEMSGANFDLLLNYCNPFTRNFGILKKGLLVRRPLCGHLVRIAEIRCSKDEAKELHEFARLINPEAALEIEKSIESFAKLGV